MLLKVEPSLVETAINPALPAITIVLLKLIIEFKFDEPNGYEPKVAPPS